MLTRRQIRAAIVKRDMLADEIKDYCAHLPFDACFKLCSPKLREEYVAANRVACFMEQEVIARGSAYRLKHSANDGKTGGLVWRTKHHWAPKIAVASGRR